MKNQIYEQYKRVALLSANAFLLGEIEMAGELSRIAFQYWKIFESL